MYRQRAWLAWRGVRSLALFIRDEHRRGTLAENLRGVLKSRSLELPREMSHAELLEEKAAEYGEPALPLLQGPGRELPGDGRQRQPRGQPHPFPGRRARGGHGHHDEELPALAGPLLRPGEAGHVRGAGQRGPAAGPAGPHLQQLRGAHPGRRPRPARALPGRDRQGQGRRGGHRQRRAGAGGLRPARGPARPGSGLRPRLRRGQAACQVQPRRPLRDHVHLRHHRAGQRGGLQVQRHQGQGPLHHRAAAGGLRRHRLHLLPPLPRQRPLPHGDRGPARRGQRGPGGEVQRQPFLGGGAQVRGHHLQRAGGGDAHPHEAASPPGRPQQPGALRPLGRVSLRHVAGLRGALRHAHLRGLRGGGRRLGDHRQPGNGPGGFHGQAPRRQVPGHRRARGRRAHGLQRRVDLLRRPGQGLGGVLPQRGRQHQQGQGRLALHRRPGVPGRGGLHLLRGAQHRVHARAGRERLRLRGGAGHPQAPGRAGVRRLRRPLGAGGGRDHGHPGAGGGQGGRPRGDARLPRRQAGQVRGAPLLAGGAGTAQDGDPPGHQEGAGEAGRHRETPTTRRKRRCRDEGRRLYPRRGDDPLRQVPGEGHQADGGRGHAGFTTGCKY